MARVPTVWDAVVEWVRGVRFLRRWGRPARDVSTTRREREGIVVRGGAGGSHGPGRIYIWAQRALLDLS